MKYTIPSSVKDFRCKAGACTDNCCIGWEIDIDDNTADFYKKVQGNFGKKLENNILHDDVSCFKLDSSERCPFLNSDNLCEIIINLGEDHLCQICRDHPRYFEWFDDLKEGGAGLCCEKAAEMIISSEDTSFTTIEINETSDSVYDHELFDFMYSSRTIIMDHVNRNDIGISEKISSVLDFCEKLQFNSDNGCLELPDLVISAPESRSDIRNVLLYLNDLEHINAEWPETLNELLKNAQSISDFRSETQIPEKYELYIKNIFNYFIWRHFMKGVFEGEFLSRIKFAAVSTAVISFMFFRLMKDCEFSPENCACAAKDYSKEIEYCEENLEAILDDSYELEFFTSENIKGLFI